MTSRSTSSHRELSARLLARAPEIEQTILTRVYSVSDPNTVADPEYVSGLRAAVGAAVRFGLEGIETGRPPTVPIPVELLSQVRSAARNQVSLETILRRYIAGHTLLSDFVIEEAKTGQLSDPGELQRLVRLQAELFDRLVDVIAAEYRAEVASGARSPRQGHTECVRKLLSGQLTDSAELGYVLSGWHVGLAVTGVGEQELCDLARDHDRRLLFVPHAEGASWAWLGGSQRPGLEELEGLLSGPWPSEARVAIGEPAEGLLGWRFTHHQALAAFPAAQCGSQPRLRYADVALLASTLQDEVLSASLRQLYLEPLRGERDGGAALLETLRAYFDSQRNVSSAASALGASRNTVTNRLQAVEQLLDRPLSACSADLEMALRLAEFDKEKVANRSAGTP
jgi:hypothetical protein